MTDDSGVEYYKLFLHFFKPRNYNLVFLPDGMDRISLSPYAAARIWTLISRVAPTCDLFKDALLVELPRRSNIKSLLVGKWDLVLIETIGQKNSQPIENYEYAEQNG